jgi:PhoPQ-activated pathogenicity-related protein
MKGAKTLHGIHLSLLWADLLTELWTIQPTACEARDFKKAVSVRVNAVKYHQCPAKAKI